MITIVHFAQPGTNRREKELEDSRAKSHAARITHSKRKQAYKLKLQRSEDWRFGGMEFTLRTLDSRVVDLHTTCPGHTPDALMSGHLVRSTSAASALRRMMMPAFQEMMQRLSSDSNLVFGTIDTCARLAIPEQRRTESLKRLMESSRYQAVKMVGRYLASGTTPSFAVKWLIMDLCLPVMLEGDLETAGIHLRGLLSLHRHLNLREGMDSLIWYVSRTAAICHAIQTSQAPLYQLEIMPSNDHWAVGYGQLGQPPTNRVDVVTFESSFTCLAWEEGGLISGSGVSSIRFYVSAVATFSAASDYEDAIILNLMYNYRLAALHQLCSIYPSDASGFDDAITIALQLHLVLDLGGLLLTTVQTLCTRLYASLRLALTTDLPTVAVIERQKCETWLLLTGLMASISDPDLHQWFTEEATTRIRRIHAKAGTDLQSICNPFRLKKEMMSPVFLQVSLNLAEACRRS